MIGLKVFVVIVLGLGLNTILQVSSQDLSCDDDEHLPGPPKCPPPQDHVANSTYFPVQYDCRKFFQCTNGVANCFCCPPGTVWNQTLETCDHEADNDCVIVTTTSRPTDPPITTTPTTTPTTRSTTPSTTTRSPPHCPNDDPMPPPGVCPPTEPMPTYFPYPYDCRKYFQCSNGQALCMLCGSEKVWNQGLEICVPDEEFHCVIVTTTTFNPRAIHLQEEQEENGIGNWEVV